MRIEKVPRVTTQASPGLPSQLCPRVKVDRRDKIWCEERRHCHCSGGGRKQQQYCVFNTRFLSTIYGRKSGVTTGAVKHFWWCFCHHCTGTGRRDQQQYCVGTTGATVLTPGFWCQFYCHAWCKKAMVVLRYFQRKAFILDFQVFSVAGLLVLAVHYC